MTETDKDFARCFGTQAGIRVLEYLHKITFARPIGPNATDNELRWAAAQCALVRQMESMVMRGRGEKS